MNTTQKIKEFSNKIKELYQGQISRLDDHLADSLEKIKEIKLIPFSNDKPFEPKDVKNSIFFTYSDHYRGNSGIHMNVGFLKDPHLDYNDRGYIKGVQTDLSGYITLKSLKTGNNFIIVANIYKPKFIKSKYSAEYENKCNLLIEKTKELVDVYTDFVENKINEHLKELTGCSLLYYLREI